MKILKIKNNLNNIIEKATESLRNGELVIYPTETSYGAGVDITNKKAVNNLLKYKNRPEGKAISIAVDSENMASTYVKINKTAENIYKTLLPGPVTVISKAKNTNIVKSLKSENNNLGIRWPNHKIPLRIIGEFKKPITATSANLSGRKTPYSIDDILNTLSENKKGRIGLILDAGELPHNKPSTIIDTTTSDLNIIRNGNITLKPPHHVQKHISKDVQHTLKIAGESIKQLINELKDTGVVYLLDGDLGSGKTHFTKGLGFALDTEDIDSPTYSIMNEIDYHTRSFNGLIVHIDTWRLSSVDDLKLLKIHSLLKPKNIVVIEWWSKYKEYIENIIRTSNITTVKVFIETFNNHREITIHRS